jgi:hypothetical protein
MSFLPAYPTPEPWTNQDLILYHGTIDLVWTDPENDAISVAAGRPDTDFGTGFYTTTSLTQASSWAIQASRRRKGSAPLVLEFTLSRDSLAALESICFVRGDPDAEDFWSLVRHCRGGRDHGRSGLGTWYDVALGPLALNRRNRTIFVNADQISFHTGDAEKVLNTSIRTLV